MPDPAQTATESEPSRNGFVIRVQNASKVFQTPSQANLGALTGIDLDIRAGEFVTVVGPSGCGKSTLLKLIAGFSACSAGRILFQDSRGAASIPKSATFLRRASYFRGSPLKRMSVLA